MTKWIWNSNYDIHRPTLVQRADLIKSKEEERERDGGAVDRGKGTLICAPCWLMLQPASIIDEWRTWDTLQSRLVGAALNTALAVRMRNGSVSLLPYLNCLALSNQLDCHWSASLRGIHLATAQHR